MADLTFNTTSGATVKRKMLLLCLNTGSGSSPTWSPVGKRVEDSSMEFDWGDETKNDILGNTYTTLKEPTIKQTFDPCELDAGDTAQLKIWNTAIRDRDVAALEAMDVLVVHLYAGTADTAAFAERYPSSAVRPTGLGGSASVGMPIDVTFGGARQTGTAAVGDGGAITFTPDSAA